MSQVFDKIFFFMTMGFRMGYLVLPVFGFSVPPAHAIGMGVIDFVVIVSRPVLFFVRVLTFGLESGHYW